MKKVKFTLDNEIIEVEGGTTILEAAESRDIFIPTFCSIKELMPVSSCYVCVVDVEGHDDLVPSCSTEAVEGMVVRTATERVKEARRTCIELLLSDHLGDCLGPCMTSCPAGIDIPGFIKHIAEGENRQALKLIKNNMPFPGILGRICSKPCEDACRRQLVEEPVAICYLKRFAADEVTGSGEEYIPVKASDTGKNIAVVGSGSAGLSAAYYLQVLGHNCTVYDENDAPGGLMRYGIPAYRLPASIIDNEVSVLEKLGVKFKCNTKIGKDIVVDELQNEYDAVFLGFGAGNIMSLGVEGEDAEGIVSGIDFLRNHNVLPDTNGLKDQNVAVIGGGDVAIDAARVAKRMGAASVNIYCLEKSDEMPASESEIKDAKAEGITINCELGVKGITEKGGDQSCVEFMCCTSVFNEEGDFCPEYSETEVSKSDFDTVIVAIGQTPDPGMARGIKTAENGLLIINENTLQTSTPGVFAGGDCVTGPKTVVDAVAAGRKAAISVDQFVLGREVTGEPIRFDSTMGPLEEIVSVAFEKFDKLPRLKIKSLKAKERIKSFDEVELGFLPEDAVAEAKRCMECGCRAANDCRLRIYSACFGADEDRYFGETQEYNLDDSHPDIVYASHKCIKCRTCVRITEEILGTSAMQVTGRGFSVSIRPSTDNKLALVNPRGLEKIVRNCPVGALTFKNDPVQTLSPVFKRPEVRC